MKKLIILSAFLMTTFAGFSQKFVYVDMDYVLSKMDKYTEAQAELDKLAEQWQKEIQAEMQEVEKMYNAFQAEQVLMTDQMKQQKISEIEKKEREVKELQKAKFGANGELFQKREELIKPIQDEIYEVIQKIAKEKRYDMVLEKSSMGILYTNGEDDISEDVIDEVGK